MKKIFSLLLCCVITKQLAAQGITKTAKGEGTVLYKGNNISLDIGETDLSFGFNNLQRSLGRDEAFIWGSNLKAKNESGIAGLFSKGDFVPASSLNFFSGYSFSNGIPNGLRKPYEDAMKTYTTNIEELDVALTENIKAQIQYLVSGDELQLLRDELLKKFAASRTQKEFVNSLGAMKPEKENETRAILNLETILKKVIKEFEAKVKVYEDEIERMDNKLNETTYWQLMFFGFGGITSSEFKYFKGIDSVTIGNSFSDQYFRGGHFGIGANFQYGRFMFGATYNYKKTNNFHLLTKKDYTLRTTNTVNNQALIQEKKITGYAGTYGTVEINEFAFDFMWREKLDKEGKNSLLINPYIRSQFLSRNKELLPNSTNIGAGFYFFQNTGKFLGGIYFELPDVKQNYEKAKPVTEQSLRKPLNRISFGITGRLSIGSFLNWF